MQKDFAVFVDRDGTINVDVDFLSSPNQLQLIPRSADAIRELNDLHIPVIVITNQSGIARGLYSEEDLGVVHQALAGMLHKVGASILAYYYCPHHPKEGVKPYIQDCECRKPKPGMLHSAQKKYGFKLERSFVVGDKCIDMQTARAVGATAIQVATGYGTGEKDLCVSDRDYFATDLYDAVQIIKRKIAERN
ncbi:MAG: HAD family hydrolase [Bacteroidota bacterium]|nr:HAD family hydrolase [Bacteroidota bacterium]